MPRAKVGDAELEYEVHGRDGGEPLVLIMGIGAQLVHWPEGFVDQLVERDFQVVRFDNRDVGLSSKLEHLGVPNAGLALLRALLGLKVQAPYSHMAGDVVGLLDHLGWRTAHVVGASMGGMIAQTLGIEHGSRLRSLTSLMSTTGCRTHLGSVKAMLALFGPPPTNRDEAKAAVDRALTVYGSPGHVRTPEQLEATRERAARAFDRDAKAGMIGINVPIPVPVAFHSFGGWKRSIFGDRNVYGMEGVGFYTKMKTTTARWPTGIREGAQFVIPTTG